MERPRRKPTRLRDFDYSTPGVYFVTICTRNKQPILSSISVGEGLCALPKNNLTEIGKTVECSIQYLQKQKNNIAIEKYVIMPKHIHMLIVIRDTGGHRGPPLQSVIQQFKSYTTHQYGAILWQRSFYDHIIRGEQDCRKIWEYIDNNPAKWTEDCFYVE